MCEQCIYLLRQHDKKGNLPLIYDMMAFLCHRPSMRFMNKPVLLITYLSQLLCSYDYFFGVELYCIN